MVAREYDWSGRKVCCEPEQELPPIHSNESAEESSTGGKEGLRYCEGATELKVCDKRVKVKTTSVGAIVLRLWMYRKSIMAMNECNLLIISLGKRMCFA